MGKPLIAYCFASGQIAFGRSLPNGTIEIARGKDAVVRKEVAVTARLAYDGKTLLVPGIPEAPDQAVAFNMLALHLRWLKHRENADFVVATRQRPLPKSRHAVKRLLAHANAAAGGA